MRFTNLFSVGLLGIAAFFAGCATGGSDEAPAVRRALPDAIGARFAPPEFATRQIDGERAAVLDAALAAANGLGYSVSRFDGAGGRISASRRQVSSFDGARQNTLEITVRTFAPGVSQVSTELREAVESSGWNESSGALAASALVRDRVPYDVFFERLEAALREAGAAAASSAAP
jgi:hypothetical protein